jgi:hypothetical protein
MDSTCGSRGRAQFKPQSHQKKKKKKFVDDLNEKIPGVVWTEVIGVVEEEWKMWR